MVKFLPKDDEIKKLLDRMTVNHATLTKSSLANQFSKYKEIRYLRKKDIIFIGKDHRKDKSIIFVNGKLPIKKSKNYFFEK